jgi:hypothetical protein
MWLRYQPHSALAQWFSHNTLHLTILTARSMLTDLRGVT